MSSYDQRQSVLRRLNSFELREASMWVAAKWFEQFVRGDGRAGGSAKFVEFGAFEPNLAEAIVLDHGFGHVVVHFLSRLWLIGPLSPLISCALLALGWVGPEEN